MTIEVQVCASQSLLVALVTKHRALTPNQIMQRYTSLPCDPAYLVSKTYVLFDDQKQADEFKNRYATICVQAAGEKQ